MVRILEARNGPAIGHFFPSLELEQVDQRPAFGVAGQFRKLEDPHREHFPERREDEQPVVRAGHEEVLDRILLVGAGTLEPLATAPLRAIGVGRRSLDVAGTTDRHDHRGLGDQLGHVADVARFATDLRPPVVGMLAFEFEQFRADEPADVGLVGKDAAEFADLCQQFMMLAGELLLLEIHQLAERQPQDRIGLHRREPVGFTGAAFLLQDGEAVGAKRPLQQCRRRLDLTQPRLGLRLRLRTADDPDHLINVGQRHEQAFERVLAAAGLLEEVLRATAEHRRAVPEKFLQHVLERQNPRLPVDEREKDERERRLQR